MVQVDRDGVFGDGRIILFHSDSAILFDEMGNEISTVDFSINSEDAIEFDEARNRMICGRLYQRLEFWDFVEGRMLSRLGFDFPTPNFAATPKLREAYPLVTGSQIWINEHGNVLHQRAMWTKHLKTSTCGDHIVLPTESCGVLFQISTDRVIGECPFRGSLAASHCIESSVIMLNDDGELFQAKFD